MNRWLGLMQTLVKPAFLGAGLVLVTSQLAIDLTVCAWSLYLWLKFLFGFWFLIYFSVAYLTLEEIKKNDIHREKYGAPDFTFDLITSGMALGALYVLGFSYKEQSLVMRLDVAYLIVTAIPCLAVVSNHRLGRNIKWIPSIGAVGASAVGYMLVSSGANLLYHLFVLAVLFAVLWLYVVLEKNDQS